MSRKGRQYWSDSSPSVCPTRLAHALTSVLLNTHSGSQDRHCSSQVNASCGGSTARPALSCSSRRRADSANSFSITYTPRSTVRKPGRLEMQKAMSIRGSYRQVGLPKTPVKCTALAVSINPSAPHTACTAPHDRGIAASCSRRA
jgi:hypothetical protein